MFIVYESAFRGRFIVRRIISETESSYKVQVTSDSPESPAKHIRKRSLGPIAILDDLSEANKLRTSITERMVALYSAYEDDKLKIYNDLKNFKNS